jgi:hypothetical protein
MLGVELAAIDLVVQLGRQLALGDVVAGEFSGIGIEDAQLHVAKAQVKVGVQRSAQHVDFTGDRDRRELIDRTVDVHLAREFGFDDRPVTVPSML